jgi:hypothetical protein
MSGVFYIGLDDQITAMVNAFPSGSVIVLRGNAHFH